MDQSSTNDLLGPTGGRGRGVYVRKKTSPGTSSTSSNCDTAPNDVEIATPVVNSPKSSGVLHCDVRFQEGVAVDSVVHLPGGQAIVSKVTGRKISRCGPPLEKQTSIATESTNVGVKESRCGPPLEGQTSLSAKATPKKGTSQAQGWGFANEKASSHPRPPFKGRGRGKLLKAHSPKPGGDISHPQLSNKLRSRHCGVQSPRQTTAKNGILSPYNRFDVSSSPRRASSSSKQGRKNSVHSSVKEKREPEAVVEAMETTSTQPTTEMAEVVEPLLSKSSGTTPTQPSTEMAEVVEPLLSKSPGTTPTQLSTEMTEVVEPLLSKSELFSVLSREVVPSDEECNESRPETCALDADRKTPDHQPIPQIDMSPQTPKEVYIRLFSKNKQRRPASMGSSPHNCSPERAGKFLVPNFSTATALCQNRFAAMPRYVDSHCHIDLILEHLPYSGTWKELLDHYAPMIPNSFAGLIQVFCYPKNFYLNDRVVEMLLPMPSIWFTFGCHPKHARNFNEDAYQRLRICLTRMKHKVVALGEIGLDYSGNFYYSCVQQRAVLRRQVQLAVELGLPLVLHCRENDTQTRTSTSNALPFLEPPMLDSTASSPVKVLSVSASTESMRSILETPAEDEKPMPSSVASSPRCKTVYISPSKCVRSDIIPDAHEDCLQICKEVLTEVGSITEQRIHLHCFTSDWATAQKWLATFPQLCIGITPLITTRNQRVRNVQEVAANIPLNRLLLETDSPYFLPNEIPAGEVPRSLPWFSAFVAHKISLIRSGEVSTEEILYQTTKNFQHIYGIRQNELV